MSQEPVSDRQKAAITMVQHPHGALNGQGDRVVDPVTVSRNLQRAYSALRVLERITGPIIKLNLWSIRIIAPIAAGLVAFAFLYTLVTPWTYDPTQFGLSCVGVFAGLAGVLFAYACCLSDNIHKTRIVFAGEKFLLAVILALFATVLLYARFYLTTQAVFSEGTTGFIIVGCISWFGVAAFIQAVVIAWYGVMVLNEALWKRHGDGTDWGRYL
jgi:hypothetical protein